MVQGIFLKNIKLKILALLLGTITYFYVYSETNPVVEREYRIPLKLEGLQEGFFTTSPLPEVVVRLKSRHRTFASLTPRKHIIASLKLNNLEKGSHELFVGIQAPKEAELVSYKPKKVNLFLDRKSSQVFPVSFVKVGKPPSHVFMRDSETVLKPDQVRVSGFEENVNKVATVEAKVSLLSILQDTQKVVVLRALDAEGRVVPKVKVFPEKTTVWLKVSPQMFKQADVSVTVDGKPAEGFKVEEVRVVPDRVIIQGPQNRLTQIESVKTRKVSINGAKQTVTADIPLVRPAGVVFMDKEIARVTVTISSTAPAVEIPTPETQP